MMLVLYSPEWGPLSAIKSVELGLNGTSLKMIWVFSSGYLGVPMLPSIPGSYIACGVPMTAPPPPPPGITGPTFGSTLMYSEGSG
jgi:hypothetical protein